MEQCHILTALRKYAKMRPARFHTPGHRAEKPFIGIFKGAKYDITELSFSDSLQDPNGIIAQAQNDIARILGAAQSYITTDGSSSGICAMLAVAKQAGSKIIITRNAHKSVYSALELLDFEPLILRGNEKEGIELPVSAEKIGEQLKKDPNLAGVLINGYDYYGNVCEFQKIKDVCRNYRKLFLVDNAHGAHARFDPDALYPSGFADLWVDGAHKTLPVLTQGAIVSAANPELGIRLAAALTKFTTTSPSYPIMASVEYGVKYTAEFGTVQIELLKREISLSKTRLKKKGYEFYSGNDPLKFTVDFKSVRINPYLAQEELERRGIFCEMNDGRNLLFLITPMTKLAMISKLERALRKLLRIGELKNTYVSRVRAENPVKRFSYLTALGLDGEWVDIGKSAGRICGRNVGACPPCVPMLIAGEVITQDMVNALLAAKSTYGTRLGKIYVIITQDTNVEVKPSTVKKLATKLLGLIR